MHTNRAILFGQFDRNLITESLWTFGIHFDSITLKLQGKASYTFEVLGNSWLRGNELVKRFLLKFN